MDNRFINVLPIGNVRFYGKDMLPSWAITHYLEQFCLNHMKLVIIQKICVLTSQGFPDSSFSVSAQSAEIFPKTTFSEKRFLNIVEYYDNALASSAKEDREGNRILSERKIISASKQEDADYFWYIIQKYKRPIVLIKVDNEHYPLFDFNSDEAAKIWSLKVQSPPEGIIRGAIGAGIDLVYAHNQENRERDEYISRQLGQSARNIEDIVRASQCINSPNTPEGVRRYAEYSLMRIMKRQAELNEEIGIRNIFIDAQA